MDWIKKIKADADESMKEVYRLYFNDITNWLKTKFNLSHTDAKEIFQLTVVIFYENVTSGKLTVLTSTLKSYLMGIARNKAMEQYRASSKFVNDDILEFVSDNRDQEIDQLQRVEKRIGIVQNSMKNMGSQCKSLLQLFYFGGMSMEEITITMQYKNSNTTKNLKYKCIKRLHMLLKDHIQTEH